MKIKPELWVPDGNWCSGCNFLDRQGGGQCDIFFELLLPGSEDLIKCSQCFTAEIEEGK